MIRFFILGLISFLALTNVGHAQTPEQLKMLQKKDATTGKIYPEVVYKDEKTGKILRIKDNRIINEVIDDKHRRMIEAALKKKEEKEQEAR